MCNTEYNSSIVYTNQLLVVWMAIKQLKLWVKNMQFIGNTNVYKHKNKYVVNTLDLHAYFENSENECVILKCKLS